MTTLAKLHKNYGSLEVLKGAKYARKGRSDFYGQGFGAVRYTLIGHPYFNKQKTGIKTRSIPALIFWCQSVRLLQS